ncbi:NUDIX domain-containing protein [Phytoactinopolyspora endophytica]|uniref:NUDIX domain-containing protein n=1 Tax=Phytoactinopolyspora endophytica TaxID=1642495 RepID=UPI00101D3D18|nr:NUDIX domain-containing protein [Phytoactinopolyspora endophytica]
MATGDARSAPETALRAHLLDLLHEIEPWDDQERAHLRDATEWISSGAPLYRVRKPDVPPMHLVSYFVVLDEVRGTLLLVAHRKAGLWLPSGGHVEPAEDPWDTVLRECLEELHIPAAPSSIAGDRPFFVTVTRTRPPENQHTDVSLWYVLHADVDAVTHYDASEFSAIRWLSPNEVLDESVDSLDPHMHRFVHKLLAAWQSAEADEYGCAGACSAAAPRADGAGPGQEGGPTARIRPGRTG